MRGNSGFLRWMIGSFRKMNTPTNLLHMSYSAIVILAMFTHFVPSISAVPLDRERRMLRDMFTEVVAVNQTTAPLPPAAAPTNTSTENRSMELAVDTCLMNGVPMATLEVQCENKPGCRAIQKTGECCPEYQCECVRDGKIFSNGEKLADPETPCRVCYCQGGEISCSNVTCYKRDDCQPKYIPGRCCPEYDNCPPLEDVGKSQNKINTDEVTMVSATMKPVKPIEAPKTDVNNPLGITIKEITKPEEIRITDKPKNQMVSPKISEEIPTDLDESATTAVANSEVLSTSSPYNLTNLEELHNQTNLVDVNPDHNDSLDDSDEGPDGGKAVRHAAGSIPMESNEEQPPTATTESAEMFSVTMSNFPDSSTSPVGHQVVIVEHNGETKPITVFGAEGLQKVEQDDTNIGQGISTVDSSTTPSSPTDVSDGSYSVSYESSSTMSELCSFGTTESSSSDSATKESVQQSAVCDSSQSSNADNSHSTERKTDKRSSGRPDDFSSQAKSNTHVISSKLDNEFLSNFSNVTEETTTQSINSVSILQNSNDNIDKESVEQTLKAEHEEFVPIKEEHIHETVFYTSEEPLAAASDKVYDAVFYSGEHIDFNEDSTSPRSVSTSEATPAMELSSSTETISTEATAQHVDEEDNSDSLENPEFPSIPDDVSNYASYTKDNVTDPVYSEPMVEDGTVAVVNDEFVPADYQPKTYSAKVVLSPIEPEFDDSDHSTFGNTEEDNNFSLDNSNDHIALSEESSGMFEVSGETRYIDNSPFAMTAGTIRDFTKQLFKL